MDVKGGDLSRQAIDLQHVCLRAIDGTRTRDPRLGKESKPIDALFVMREKWSLFINLHGFVSYVLVDDAANVVEPFLTVTNHFFILPDEQAVHFCLFAMQCHKLLYKEYKFFS